MKLIFFAFILYILLNLSNCKEQLSAEKVLYDTVKKVETQTEIFQCNDISIEMEALEYVPAKRSEAKTTVPEPENNEHDREKDIDEREKGKDTEKNGEKRYREDAKRTGIIVNWWEKRKEKKLQVKRQKEMHEKREKEKKERALQEKLDREERRQTVFVSKQKPLGKGGYGEVMLGNTGNNVANIPRNKCVAIKRVKYGQSVFLSGAKVLEKLQKSIEKEKRTHIIEMFDYGDIFLNSNIGLMIMEVGGESLRSRISDEKERENNKMDEEKLKKISMQIILPLREFHQVAIHLDFKPANLVYARAENGEEILKLVDFDSSEWIGQFPENGEIDDANHLVMAKYGYVTPLQYKSPEQFGELRKISRKVDIWSFGIILYELFLLRKLNYRKNGIENILARISEIFRGFKYEVDKISKIQYDEKWLKEYGFIIRNLLYHWDLFPALMRLVTNALNSDPTLRLSANGIVEYLKGECEIEQFMVVKNVKEIEIFNGKNIRDLEKLIKEVYGKNSEMHKILKKICLNQQKMMVEQKIVKNCDTKTTKFD